MTALLLMLLGAPAHAGLFGPDAPARIPVPAREYRVRVEDQGGTVLDVEHASFGGEIFVYGTIGLAQVTVPFDDITSLEVLPGADEDHRQARIETRSSGTVTVIVDADVPVWGKAKFGNYKILISDVKRLSVL